MTPLRLRRSGGAGGGYAGAFAQFEISEPRGDRMAFDHGTDCFHCWPRAATAGTSKLGRSGLDGMGMTGVCVELEIQ